MSRPSVTLQHCYSAVDCVPCTVLLVLSILGGRRASDLFVIFVVITLLHFSAFSFFQCFIFLLFLLDTFEMVSEDEDGKLGFKVNYHYMSQVKNANDANSAARARRLAQEAVTLSTSLPLSSSSSVFVRCDEERLDIMKVEITTVFSLWLMSLFRYCLYYSGSVYTEH